MAAAAAFRLYVDQSASGELRTGMAILNPAGAQRAIRIDLVELSGKATGLSATVSLPPMGQRALFIDEIPGLESLPRPFKGIMRVSSDQTGIAAAGIRGRLNSRGDFLMTTLPAANEAASPTGSLVFPHIVDGGGYTTEFVTFSGTATQPPAGDLRMFSQQGGALKF
jgi:hypothetical protein